MSFIEYINDWVKSEVLQGKIMVGIGVLLVPAVIAIIRSEHQLLKGSIIPLSLLLIILVGYGGFILYSRPAHMKASIERYESSTSEAYAQEKEKHINDNKAGDALMKVYPILAILSLLPLFLNIPFYYKGMGLGFALMFISIYIIDYGFVSRSNAFIAYLDTLIATK